MAMSITPVGLSRPPPIWPTSAGSMPRCSVSRDRHWSTSSLRSTTTSVGTSWWAMTAHAMTVLPAPGGATSTPRSWATRSATAVGLLGAQGRRRTGSRPVLGRGGHRSISNRLPSWSISSSTRSVEPAGKVEPLEVLAVAADEPGRVPGREPHPLLLVELRVGDRPEVLQAPRPPPAATRLARSTTSPRAGPGSPAAAGGPPASASSASVRVRPGVDRAKRLGERGHRLGCHPGDRRQERPLVGPGSIVVGIEEHCGAALGAQSPCSGRAIRLPNPAFGMKSWDGKNRS